MSAAPSHARSSAAAALSGSLPSARAAKRGREQPRADDGEEGEDAAGADSDDGQTLNDEVYREFDEHIKAIGAARDKKRERLAFKSAAEEPDEAAGGGAKVETEDQRDQLGEWLPEDRYQGQVNMRTLKQLLSRIDARGFERCAPSNRARALCVPGPAPAASPDRRSQQQLEFHEAFFRACGRVIYKDNWATDKPQIMKAEGWTKCNSEVLISTPRRFVSSAPLESAAAGRLAERLSVCRPGKDIFNRAPPNRTRSCRCTHRARIRRPSSAPASRSRWASRSSSSVSSPAAVPRPRPWRGAPARQVPPVAPRASCSSASSSKLRPFRTTNTRSLTTGLRRFLRLAGGESRIVEFNMEACRLNAFDGRKSLIRSFPSKVGVNRCRLRIQAPSSSSRAAAAAAPRQAASATALAELGKPPKGRRSRRGAHATADGRARAAGGGRAP